MSPRPPAPCSPAPGLPLSHRPAHRLLVIIALAALLISAVSAEPIVLADDKTTSDTYTIAAGSNAFSGANGKYLKIYEVQKFVSLKSIYCRSLFDTSTSANYFANLGSRSEGVTVWQGERYIGSGTIYYNVMYTGTTVSGIQLWIDIDDWDVSGLGGSQTFEIESQPDTVIFTNNLLLKTDTTKTPTAQKPILIGGVGGYTVAGGTYILTGHYSWRNWLTVNADTISLVRGGNYSVISVTSDLGTAQDTSSRDVTMRFSGSGNWTVTNIYGKSYTGALTDTPVVADTSVSIYIINSQTGALLADASLSILASAGGTEVEILNTTLPGGTATYTLQPTGGGAPNPDYYRAVATVPGFSQIIENHSFTLNGPHDVIIEMRPDTGGPTDPEKCYLEFYVRDFSANGIAGASVQCNNQIKQTNSKGYVLFEVAKNGTYPYKASKSGYTTIEGTATVADGPRYVANVVLGPSTVPTHTPTLGPGETPGATPTPDRRTNEQKGQAVIDMIADFAEPIALLAIVATVFGLMQMMMPRRR